MRNQWKRARGVCGLAGILLAGVSATSAYFTTYTTTSGSGSIELGNITHIVEETEGHIYRKDIQIQNEEGSGPVFVRVKLFYGDRSDLSFELGEGWSLGTDGFYYYDDALEATQSTSVLRVSIARVGADAEKPQDFNVVVVAESTPALYDEQGNPAPDWN